MICPKRFADELIKRGIKFFTGVPCSYLTPLLNEIMQRQDIRYVISSNEGEALAIASGAWLGGDVSMVMCQNSGLGNMVNVFTSLTAPFRIPALVLLTWRGRPGEKDEPQHQLMGRITTDLLDLMEIKWSKLSCDEVELQHCLNLAFASMEQLQQPYVLILEKECFLSESIGKNNEQKSELLGLMSETSTVTESPTRAAVLAALLKYIPDNAPLIATTGKTGRELYTLRDGAQHLYCVGSMGYANAIAHGLALTTPNKVFVLDGDGAALMHLGNLTSIGASKAGNLVHIILDNGVHDSTGGQPTASSSINFVAIARGAGYGTVLACASLEEFITTIQKLNFKGPILIHVKIQVGSMEKLVRPSITPDVVARRLRTFVRNGF